METEIQAELTPKQVAESIFNLDSSEQAGMFEHLFDLYGGGPNGGYSLMREFMCMQEQCTQRNLQSQLDAFMKEQKGWYIARRTTVWQYTYKTEDLAFAKDLTYIDSTGFVYQRQLATDNHRDCVRFEYKTLEEFIEIFNKLSPSRRTVNKEKIVINKQEG